MSCSSIWLDAFEVETFIGHVSIIENGGNMAVGFVLISTAPAKEHEVYNELLNVKEIVDKFKLRAQARHMAEKDVMLEVLEKPVNSHMS